MEILSKLHKELKKMADPGKAKLLQRYFKTGKGEYGEGDIFLGLTVPTLRSLAKKYKELDFKDIEELLKSIYHEERLIALLMLVQKFSKGSEKERRNIFDFYLKNTKYINNWDLVDLSSHEIVGGFLIDFTRTAKVLFDLAGSKNIWERRIACVSTFEFIRNDHFDTSMKLAEMLIDDEHDLMHKAVGWMLREVGKKDLELEISFLNKHYKKMPRTMLRYSIEKFPEKLRMKFLKNKV